MRTLVLVVALAACGAAPLAAQQRIHTPNAVRDLPFSEAVRVGDLLYLAGQIGVIPGTRQVVDSTIAGQTRQTLENIKAILTHAGSAMDRMVKCTVYLIDIRDYAAMNAVYATYWPTEPPARATIGVKELVFNARVEIECIALAGR